jgi:hypothetical protein
LNLWSRRRDAEVPVVAASLLRARVKDHEVVHYLKESGLGIHLAQRGEAPPRFRCRDQPPPSLAALGVNLVEEFLVPAFSGVAQACGDPKSVAALGNMPYMPYTP